MRWAVLLVAFVGLIGASDGADTLRLPRRLARMTPEQFEQSVRIKDDQLEAVTTITTEPGYESDRGLFGRFGSDNYLRAFIDKTTGAASYQLYQRILNRHYKWNDYHTVNYETPHGLKSIAVLKLPREPDCSLKRLLGECYYYETVAAPIEEPVLKGIAATYASGEAVVWKFRCKARTGVDHDDGMVAAEVAGLLAAVTDYRRAHHLPGA